MKLIINEHYVKHASPLTDLVDMKQFGIHIEGAQQLYIRKITGGEFFDYIFERVSTKTLNDKEKELYEDYIRPAVLWRALWLAAPFYQYEWRNKGFMQNTDENAQSAGFNEFKFMTQEILRRSINNEDLLNRYLCENDKHFPQFKNNEKLEPPTGDNTSHGMGLIFY